MLTLYNPQKTGSNVSIGESGWASWTEHLEKFYSDYFKSLKAPHALISVGKGMTDQQVLQYHELAKTFIMSL